MTFCKNKKFIRNCPKCEKEIIHTRKDSMIKYLNSLCKKCYYNRPKNTGPFVKNCPECNKIIKFTRSDVLFKSIKENKSCKSCSFKDKIYTEERNKKISISREGKPSNMMGKRHSKETKLKIGKSNTTSIKKAWTNPDIRKKYLRYNKWINTRLDKGQLELLEKWNRLGFRFQPNFQLKTDKFLYYLDGYDKEKNVVLEYDSRYHNSPTQKEKDYKRQTIIIEYLNPKKFWRYNSVNKKWINTI